MVSLLCLFVFYLINFEESLGIPAGRTRPPGSYFPMKAYKKFIYSSLSPVAARTYNNDTLRWEGQYENGNWVVNIPYELDNLDDEALNAFNTMVSEFSYRSCIRWVPRKNEKDFVQVIGVADEGEPSTSCYANVGRMLEEQGTRMYLSELCGAREAAAHEMFHILGFIHEHQRNDRDCYLWIAGDLLQSDAFSYGQRFQHTDETFPFDTKSVMQYPGYETMKTLDGKAVGTLHGRPTLSDWIRLNYVYCNGKHICEVNEKFKKWCHKHWDHIDKCKSVKKY